MKTKVIYYLICYLLVFGGVITPDNSLAQVNTEKLRKHDLQQGFIFNSNFRFGYSGGNSEYVSLDGTFRVDYNGDKNDIFLVTNYNYKETKTERIVNKGFVHLRGIRIVNSKFAIEAFTQQEFNEFLGLKDRKLLGSGGRFQVVNFTSQKDSLSGFKSNIGMGAMYEHEVYDLQTGEDLITQYDHLRLTNYLTLDWTISNRINIWSVGYYQPNISNFDDYRLILESGLEIWLIGQLYVTFDISYRYNNLPTGDVKKYDIVINNGLRYTFP